MSKDQDQLPRIVVDTNIVMGGLINPDHSSSGKVIQLWLDGGIEVLVSQAIQGEYLDIFSKMRFGSPTAVATRERKLKCLLVNARSVEPEVRFNYVPEDPADNRFLECAVAGQAGCIVTQDRHLLTLVEFRGVHIMTAGDFIRRYLAEAPVNPGERHGPTEVPH